MRRSRYPDGLLVSKCYSCFTLSFHPFVCKAQQFERPPPDWIHLHGMIASRFRDLWHHDVSEIRWNVGSENLVLTCRKGLFSFHNILMLPSFILWFYFSAYHCMIACFSYDPALSSTMSWMLLGLAAHAGTLDVPNCTFWFGVCFNPHFCCVVVSLLTAQYVGHGHESSVLAHAPGHGWERRSARSILWPPVGL